MTDAATEVQNANIGCPKLRITRFCGRNCCMRTNVEIETGSPATMALPHRRLQSALEGVVMLGEPTVAKPVRMRGAIFLPQQRQGDALAPHVLVDGHPTRPGTCARRLRRRSRREQKTLQRPVVEIDGQGPLHGGSLF